MIDLAADFSALWNAGRPAENPYKTPAAYGGAGMDARLFVQGLLKNATYVRFENNRPGQSQKDKYERTLATAIIGTPKGEINVQAELIRSGFSNYVQAFGPSAEYHALYTAAQDEAVRNKRGPMWGGGAPASVQYQVAAPDISQRTIATVSPSAAALVDADTFNLGPMAGEMRLFGVNAPEMTSWAGVDKGVYFDKAAKLRSTGHGQKLKKGEGIQGLLEATRYLSDISREPRWLGIRPSVGGHSSWMPKRDVMKPHPEYGFPAGRAQPWEQVPSVIHERRIDVETQGLASKSRVKGYHARAALEPLGISQITIAEPGKKAYLNTFLAMKPNKERLLRAGVNLADLESDRPLPKALTDQDDLFIRGPWDPELGSRWDRAAAIHGSTPNKILRRHSLETLKGINIREPVDVYRQIANEWTAVAAKGEQIRYGSWNVQFDLPVLIAEMRRYGFSDQVDAALKGNSIAVREMAEHVHAMRFEHMLNSNWRPVMSNRAMFEAAKNEGLTRISRADADRLGLIKENQGLADLIDDLKGGRTALEARAKKWLSGRAGDLEAEKVAADYVNRFSKVAEEKSWDSFKEVLTWGHRNAYEPTAGGTQYSVLGQIYGSADRHAHPFGNISELPGDLLTGPMAGHFSGMNFVAGTKLGDVASNLVTHHQELGVDPSSVTQIQRLIETAHDSDIDVEQMEVLHRETERIRKDKILSDRYMQIDRNIDKERALQGLNSQFQDFLDTPVGDVHAAAEKAWRDSLKGGGTGMKKKLGDIFSKGEKNWGWIVGGAAALYMLGSHNKIDREPVAIEGQRRADSNYNRLSGIRPSELPFSNITPFHSGYSNFELMAQTAPQGAPIQMMQGPASVHMPVGIPEYEHPPAVGPEHGLVPESYEIPAGVGRSDSAAGLSAGMAFGRENRRARMEEAQENTLAAAMRASQTSSLGDFDWGDIDGAGTWEGGDDLPESIPVGYGGAAAARFRDSGYAGYVQMLSQGAMSSRIRDQATQLSRLPGMPVTPQGRHSYSENSHAEAEAFSESVGEMG